MKVTSCINMSHLLSKVWEFWLFFFVVLFNVKSLIKKNMKYVFSIERRVREMTEGRRSSKKIHTYVLCTRM